MDVEVIGISGEVAERRVSLGMVDTELVPLEASRSDIDVRRNALSAVRIDDDRLLWRGSQKSAIG